MSESENYELPKESKADTPTVSNHTKPEVTQSGKTIENQREPRTPIIISPVQDEESTRHTSRVTEVTANTLTENNLTMYQLLGDPPLTSQDTIQYERSNADLVSQAPERIRGLFNNTSDIVKYAAAIRSLGIFQTHDVSQFLETGLTDPRPIIRNAAVEAIILEPDVDKRRMFLEIARNNPDTREAAIRATGALPADERYTVLEAVLKNTNKDNFTLRAKLAAALRKPKHDNNTLDAKLAAIRALGVEPDEEKRLKLFEIALSDPIIDVRYEAVKHSALAAMKDRQLIIKKGLADENYGVTIVAMESIMDADDSDKLALLEIARARHGETSSILKVEATMASPFERELTQLPNENRQAVVESKLADQDQSSHDVATSSLGEIPSSDRQILIDAFPDIFAPIEKLAITNPLYDKQPKSFSQRELIKDGSRTILFDKIPGQNESLRNRLIRRIIPISSYLAWKKAYEAADFWKSKGFDYVPVEPIIEVKQDKEDPTMSAVDTRVIQGAPVDIWNKNKGSPYKKEIKEIENKIKDGLKELGIDHGHDHDGNFMVMFNKDANGNPDITIPPRVYVFDFDRAKNTLALAA